MASYERCVLVAIFSQARLTISSLTLRRPSLILSASGADRSFSETILRYWTSLSESLGDRPDQFESVRLCIECADLFFIICFYILKTFSVLDIPVICAISWQLLPSAFFFDYQDTFFGSSLTTLSSYFNNWNYG
jgi:hypothetical protein